MWGYKIKSMKKHLKYLFTIFIIFSIFFVSFSSSFSSTKKTYYYNAYRQKVSTPTTDLRSGATAKCKDGTYSYSKTRKGTCSGHKGVSIWY